MVARVDGSRKGGAMFRRIVPAIVCFSVIAAPALAENAGGQAAPESSGDAIEPMEAPQAGDHWTYETKDEITGVVKATTTQVITEVTPTAISMRIGAVGNGNFNYVTYDHAWNATSNNTFKYTPNAGDGVRLPLEVGKKWSSQTSDFSSAHTATFKRSTTSKVTTRESVTTSAGTFDAFKIETSSTVYNPNDPTKKNEFVSETWWVPAIDHFVKRVMTSRSGGQIRDKTSMELVEYGRR